MGIFADRIVYALDIAGRDHIVKGECYLGPALVTSILGRNHEQFDFDFTLTREMVDFGFDLLAYDRLQEPAATAVFEFPVTRRGAAESASIERAIIAYTILRPDEGPACLNGVIQLSSKELAPFRALLGAGGRAAAMSYASTAGGVLSHADFAPLGFLPLTNNGGLAPYIQAISADYDYGDSEKAEKAMAAREWAAAMWVGYCAALLLKDTSRITSVPSARLNRKRVERGDKPLPTRHIVKLSVPGSGGRTYTGNEEAGDRRASPRHHFRRGHLRHLRQERVIPVAPTWVGDPTLGEITKAYQVVESAGSGDT